MAEKLRREVEPPQRRHGGLGVMLVASAVMFFAVAGSAFILRARMAGPCGAHPRAPAPVSAPAPAPAETTAPAPPAECGRAIYRAAPDGALTVTYELCPPEVRQPADATIPPAVYQVDLEPAPR